MCGALTLKLLHQSEAAGTGVTHNMAAGGSSPLTPISGRILDIVIVQSSTSLQSVCRPLQTPEGGRCTEYTSKEFGTLQ